MFLNIIMDIEDVVIKERIQESLIEAFGEYTTIDYQNIQKPIIIFKEIKSLKQLKDFKNKRLDHHSVIFIINEAEHMFASIEQYPLCFIRKSNNENDIKGAIELISNVFQNLEQVLTLKLGYSYIQIQSSQITYIESLGHYLIIHTNTGQYRVREKLNQFLNKTYQQNFTQIHKSYIINESYVKEKRANEIIMESHDILPIGRKFKKV